MTPAVWIALLSTSAWGVINTVVAALVIRSRTKAETVKIASESENYQQDAEDKIYKRLQGQLQNALDRASHAEGRADKAIDQSNKQGMRLMMLVEMFEKHAPTDKWMKDKLIELGVAAEDIPVAPLNPYEVLAAMDKDEKVGTNNEN